jgi:hypothetical protein
MRETSDSGRSSLSTRLRGKRRAETVSGLLSKPVSTERPLADVAVTANSLRLFYTTLPTTE